MKGCIALIDFTDLPGVEHYFLDQIKWKNKNGDIKELKIYSKIAHKWSQIATRLGCDPGEIHSIQKNYPFDDHDRVTAVFRLWFDNAKNLPNACRYPKSWPGLINLLEDAELGEVVRELHTALLSPHNSVRGNV